MAKRTRKEAIESFRADMARLLAAVSRFPETRQASAIWGDWTIKEVLAHVAAWDRLLVESVEDALAGRLPALTAHASRAAEAALNQQVAAASRDRAFDAVLAELREAHQSLMTRIEALSDDEWESAAPYRWWNGTPMTVWSLFDYSYEGETHYGGHATELEKWLAGET